jgi:hypothetical protein
MQLPAAIRKNTEAPPVEPLRAAWIVMTKNAIATRGRSTVRETATQAEISSLFRANHFSVRYEVTGKADPLARCPDHEGDRSA